MKLKIFIILAFAGSSLKAQYAHFVKQGVISYEKKVNVYGIFTDQMKRNPNDTWTSGFYEEYKRNNPQFKTLKSTLTFSGGYTLFVPQADEKMQSMWGSFPATEQNNTVFTDTQAGTSIAQKQVFENAYLLKDSVRKTTWKITDEFREIAGYNCRRANAIIMDSIYVVAFYTEKIPVSGGPESFAGLPGMILGVALPREHITWFATAVTERQVSIDSMKAPSKGKPITTTALYDVLKEAMKDWGSGAGSYIRAAFF